MKKITINMALPPGVEIYPPKRRGQKWRALTPKGNIIEFGDPKFEGKRNKTRDQWQRYIRRAALIRDKRGRYSVNDPESPNFYAVRILWENVWGALTVKSAGYIIRFMISDPNFHIREGNHIRIL